MTSPSWEHHPTRSLEDIDPEACLSLMATQVVGRLGFLDGDQPLILPVNYALDGLSIVFRTAPGSKHRARWRKPACFEVDHFDRSARRGWSVVVKGLLEEVGDQDPLLASLRRLPLEPWVDGTKQHWMRLLIEEVTGRRLVPANDTA